MKLTEAFPTLVSDLIQLLEKRVENELLDQLKSVEITRVTFDETTNAGYIYVEPSRDLNIVEKNIIGVKHGKTIPLEGAFWSVLDTDNFGRLSGIEILNPGNLKSELERQSSA